MRKRLTAIFIALTIAVSLLPTPAAAAFVSHEQNQIKPIVTALVKDYAASVQKSGADDTAFWDFFNHGFYGGGKDMIIKESDAFVSSLFNSLLMQEALIEGITNGIILSQKVRQDVLFLSGGPSWHNFADTYGYVAYIGEARASHCSLSWVANAKDKYSAGYYTGPQNEHDEVMHLLIGGIEGGIVLKKLSATEDSAVYSIELRISDYFDFDLDSYKYAENEGYDTTTDDRLVKLGILMNLMGLDDFYWEYNKSFQIEVPTACTHSTGSYHWSYDAETVTLTNDTANGFSPNPTAKLQYNHSENGITDYFELDKTVVLDHSKPWVMECTLHAGLTLRLSPLPYTYNVLPRIVQSSRSYAAVIKNDIYFPPGVEITSATSTLYDQYTVGASLLDAFDYSGRNHYICRIENKLNSDGSNMPYISIIDEALGEVVFGPVPMTTYWTQYAGEDEKTLQDEPTDFLVGTDLLINYIGGKDLPLPKYDFDLKIWENGKDSLTASSFTTAYTAPTCTADGGTVYTCTDCGYTYLSEIETATGHRYTDYTNDGNATCTTDGTKTRSCTVCGYVDIVTVEGSALGHKFGTHKFDHNSTCTADGTLTAVCEVCGEKDVINADGSATGHNHKPTVTAPTCTEQGYTTYTCHCGDSYVDDYTEPTGHTEETIPAVPATCVEKGLNAGKQCSVCGEITVPQTPTAYGNHTWDAGEVIKAPTATEPGTLMYTCIHCSKTTHMSITEMPSAGFDDVPADAYYAAAVAWAKENGITSGLSETLFGSDMSCTRGQVVTFLWAAAGRPEPKTTDNPFTDVAETDYFYKPVLWAVENGITGGIGEGLFGPSVTCTRGQIVTFLWASQGKPQSGSSTFTDVLDTDWYAKSVVWAAENSVTGGIGNNMFGPNNTCTRAQVVTFLYKVYG